MDIHSCLLQNSIDTILALDNKTGERNNISVAYNLSGFSTALLFQPVIFFYPLAREKRTQLTQEGKT